MAVKIQYSQTINKPVAAVFDFMARDHIRNHPRWDPSIELEQLTPGPIGVGTIIRRRTNRGGTVAEGTMEVVAFEPNRAVGTIIKDGPVEMRGLITFEAAGPNRTVVTRIAEFPDDAAPVDTVLIQTLLKQTGQTLQELLESER
jgi:hypothetical protein